MTKVRVEEQVQAWRRTFYKAGTRTTVPTNVLVVREVDVTSDGSRILATEPKHITLDIEHVNQVKGMSRDDVIGLGHALLHAAGRFDGDPLHGRPVVVVVRAASDDDDEPDSWVVDIDSDDDTGRVTVRLGGAASFDVVSGG